MTLANADPGSTITFASYLSGAVELESPLPEITADMSIGGPNLVTLMRDPGAALFRVFTITGAVEVGLSNLVIRGGNAVDGAGLFVPAGATANLYQVAIWGNMATVSGGGIRNEGTCTVEDSAIYQNSATSGGGISNNGTLYVQSGSEIYGNTARGDGGGILNDTGRTCVVSNSSITWNTAANAAIGIGRGGGIFNAGTLQVSNTTISNNTAFWAGGGLLCARGSTATITSVTVSHNRATNGGGTGVGGGFYVEGTATFSAASCTLSNNVADDADSRGGYVELNGPNYTWSGSAPLEPIFFEDPI